MTQVKKYCEKITQDRILALAESQMFGLENPGICIACGCERGECEPDARNYPCDCCGKKRVFGAQELMLMTVA